MMVDCVATCGGSRLLAFKVAGLSVLVTHLLVRTALDR